MNEWLASIGTGPNQEELINNAKYNGYKVLGIDKTPNLKIVNQSISISTYNYEEILKKVRTLNLNIVGVIVRGSGPALLSAAYLSENLKLPTTTVELANCMVSKSALRLYAASKNVDFISGKSVNKLPSWQEGADFVIKPDQPIYGKMNVYRVKTLSQLNASFKAAQEESLNDNVECEEYVEGRDINVLCAFRNGELRWHFIFEELVEQINGKFSAKGMRGPIFFNNKNIEEQLIRSALLLTENLNISGLIFFSFKLLDDGNIKIFEINSGLCGDGIIENLFPKIWPDYNFYALDISLSVGKKVEFPMKIISSTKTIEINAT